MGVPKAVVWLGGEIKTPPFSAQTRQDAGMLLRLLQHGEHVSFPFSRPMPEIGPHCHELRIWDSENRVHWRIMYHIAFDAIVILDILKKKSGKTPKISIERSKQRLKIYNQASKE